MESIGESMGEFLHVLTLLIQAPAYLTSAGGAGGFPTGGGGIAGKAPAGFTSFVNIPAGTGTLCPALYMHCM